MQWTVYAIVILAYMLVLMGYNIRRSVKVRSQEDFMVRAAR